jgi:hypothetical protein
MRIKTIRKGRVRNEWTCGWGTFLTARGRGKSGRKRSVSAGNVLTVAALERGGRAGFSQLLCIWRNSRSKRGGG